MENSWDWMDYTKEFSDEELSELLFNGYSGDDIKNEHEFYSSAQSVAKMATFHLFRKICQVEAKVEKLIALAATQNQSKT
ncbi:MAG: hypothetical protein V3V47_00395 [Desulfobacteria bacterium]